MEGNAQFCSRYRGSNNTSLLFRSTTSICQPLRHFVPPRNATGHGRGRGLKVVFQFRYEDTLCTSPLCFATQNIGERPKKHLFLRRGVRKIVVHSSQQREERTKKRCRSYRAFRLVASVVVGVCGTRFAQTVLALFPPSSLRLRRPIKAELTSPFSGFIQLSFF